MIVSSSPTSSSFDDDAQILRVITIYHGVGWGDGGGNFSQKPSLLRVVEIDNVGELKQKKETKRFRKHDLEISTHCYPDREAVMQGELERTKKPNDRQSVKDQTRHRHRQTRSDARVHNVKTTKGQERQDKGLPQTFLGLKVSDLGWHCQLDSHLQSCCFVNIISLEV